MDFKDLLIGTMITLFITSNEWNIYELLSA